MRLSSLYFDVGCHFWGKVCRVCTYMSRALTTSKLRIDGSRPCSLDSTRSLLTRLSRLVHRACSGYRGEKPESRERRMLCTEGRSGPPMILPPFPRYFADECLYVCVSAFLSSRVALILLIKYTRKCQVTRYCGMCGCIETECDRDWSDWNMGLLKK